MTKYFDITINAFSMDTNEDYTTSIELPVYDDLQTLIPYLYEKHFNIPYRELAWYLEPGAKEFVKDIEDKWLHNTLDTSSILNSDDFKDYIIDKNLGEIAQQAEDELKDEIEQDLRFTVDLETLEHLDDYITIDCSIDDTDYEFSFDVEFDRDELEEELREDKKE